MIEVEDSRSGGSQREQSPKSQSLLVLRHSAAARGRTLGVLFFAGGMFALVVVAVPHGDTMDELPVLILALAACVTGGALWFVGPQFSARVLHFTLAFGTAEITLAAYFSHGSGPSVAFAFFYTWVGLYASLFFTPRQAQLHLLVCAGAFASVLVANSESGGPADWVLAMGTTTIVILVVGAIMAELFEAQASLVKKERLSALGELATVVGHELRNPLAAAINDLYFHRMQLAEQVDPVAFSAVTRAEAQINRAAQLSEDLTSYMGEREPQLTEICLDDLIGEVLEVAPPPKGIDVVLESSVPVMADPALLLQVLTNLVTNGYQAMTEGGTLKVASIAEGGGTTIWVEDSGLGFDANVADRIFDPFFTTKDEGTGLGLAIVHRLVERHLGTVTAVNAPSGGARVKIWLPGKRTPR